MNKDQRKIHRKLRILHHAEEMGHINKTCRYIGVGRSSFYRWRDAYRKHGEEGLINRSPIPKWHANRSRGEGSSSSQEVSSRANAHRLVSGAPSRYLDI